MMNQANRVEEVVNNLKKTINIQLYVEVNGGISDYKMIKDQTGKIMFELRGRFTTGQLLAMVDAGKLDNEEFCLPNSFKVVDNQRIDL